MKSIKEKWKCLIVFQCMYCWVPYRVGPAHMHCQSSFMSLFQKSVWRNREKNSESVEWVKKKKEIFFFAQVTYKEDKLVEFSWRFWVLQPWRVGVFRGRFCYWLCSEIVFTLWDLFVIYSIYCEHKFSINLIVVISIS